MQGIFRPPRDGAGNRPPPLDTTGVSWAENLSHPQIRRSRLPAPPVPAPPPPPPPPPAAPGAAPAAAAVPAPGAAAVPAEIVEVIHAPMQRFSLAENVFFIVPRSEAAPAAVPAAGHWISRYVIADADEDVTLLLPPGDPAVAAGVAVDRRLARPEGSRVDQELPDSERDGLTDAQLQSVTPYPDPRFALLHRHFFLADPSHFQVGELWLRKRAEEAERLDYEFALRMQGLQNSGINAVWVCSEMGAEPGDRPDMMEQFLRSYLARFLSQAPMSALDNPDAIIREAVQMHQQVTDGFFFGGGTESQLEIYDGFTGVAGSRPPAPPLVTRLLGVAHLLRVYLLGAPTDSPGRSSARGGSGSTSGRWPPPSRRRRRRWRASSSRARCGGCSRRT